MTRRDVTAFLREVDEATVEALEYAEREQFHAIERQGLTVEIEAATIVATSNLAIARATRAQTAYLSDGFDRLVQTVAAAGRTDLDPRKSEDRIRILMAIEGISRAIGARPDARARIRAARRGRRIS